MSNSTYIFSDVEMEHIEHLRQWAAERGILDAANTMKQLGKTSEELKELAAATLKGDFNGTLDAIGDVWVTLIIGALQNNFEFSKDEGFQDAFVEFDNMNVPFITFFVMALGDLNAASLRGKLTKQHYLVALSILKTDLGCWLDDAIEMVWGVISKRTGKTVNGVFIKEEDLTGGNL